jgi:GTP 3',8-cyclase
MIVDNHNRIHNYLRISLTDNCNLRCFYCMPDDEYDFTPASKLMQANEIEAIAKIFVQLGVHKIRLTGGEPLVRKDFGTIISKISTLPVNLTITTNGSRLNQYADILKDAGIESLNISLDTLQKEKFLFLTKRDLFEDVYKNILLMVDKGFIVKINVVVMKGINENEVIDFIKLTQHLPVHVRFIEFMPFTGNRWNNEKVFTWQNILAIASEQFDILPLERLVHETAKKYIVPGHLGTFAVISTMSSPFCGDCNRIRLTADGKLKNCLFSTSETDLLTPFRNGEDIAPLIHQNIKAKEKELGGQFTTATDKIETNKLENRSMITIGG